MVAGTSLLRTKIVSTVNANPPSTVVCLGVRASPIVWLSRRGHPANDGDARRWRRRWRPTVAPDAAARQRLPLGSTLRPESQARITTFSVGDRLDTGEDAV